jgi:hypothetical protein
MVNIFRVIIVTVLMFVAAKLGFSQDIYFPEHFRFVVDGPVDTSWKQPFFVDTAWEIGEKSIGYGDGDDHTLIDTATSVYLRYRFIVTDAKGIGDLCMKVDFDDAFAAYINGKEVVRVNLGAKGTRILPGQLADRSHEAEGYRHLKSRVPGFYIDKEKINDLLVEGENVLAVQVHNDSVKGSDLSFSCDLYEVTWAYNIYNEDSRYIRLVDLDSTRLPIIVIESDEFGVPVKNIEVPATMKIFDSAKGAYNKAFVHSPTISVPINIEVRGQSSAGFPKRSYNIETLDFFGNGLKAPLLGMPAETDWVLYGPFADKSLLRNALIYELARKTGQWAPRVVFCELILNGQYMGLYNLIEDIDRSHARLGLARLKPEDVSGMDVTGGYILKYDKGSDYIQLDYPKPHKIQPEQKSYITSFFENYLQVVGSGNIFDEHRGVQNIIDYQSLTDYIIISELGKNCDAYLFSSYMHKDRDDKDGRLKFGPVWDFDLCFGNTDFQEGARTYGWQFEYYRNNRFNIKRHFMDTNLVNLFQSRWELMRSSFLSNDSLFARIDTLTSELMPAIERNYAVWPVIDKPLFFPAYSVNSYHEEIGHIKNWIAARTAWIDRNIGQIYYKNPYQEGTSVFSEKWHNSPVHVFPNPFSSVLYLQVNGSNNINVTYNITSISGQKVLSGKQNLLHNGQNEIIIGTKMLQPGIYVLEVETNRNEKHWFKIIKD